MTTCKNLMLSSQETHTGHKGFICVGTTHVYGEDITCRGRVGVDIIIIWAVDLLIQHCLASNRERLCTKMCSSGQTTVCNDNSPLLVLL